VPSDKQPVRVAFLNELCRCFPKQHDAGRVERAAKDAPAEGRIQRELVRLYRQTAQPERLLESLLALQRLEGDDLERTAEIAALLERAGRTEEASRVLEGMISTSTLDRPVPPTAFEQLDRCYATLGNTEERIALARRRVASAASDPERASANGRLAELLTEHGDLDAAWVACAESPT